VRGRHRLELSGANVAAIYPDEGIQVMRRFSYGILCLINTICENSLIAVSSQAKQTTPTMAQEVAMDLCLEAAPASSTLESDDLEEVLGLRGHMIEEGDDFSKTSSHDFKTETGAKTI
jgi:hypothetical protein